jgi:hypothetical protein
MLGIISPAKNKTKIWADLTNNDQDQQSVSLGQYRKY